MSNNNKNTIAPEEYSISMQAAKRKRLEKDVANFLLNGGEIKQIPTCILADHTNQKDRIEVAFQRAV